VPGRVVLAIAPRFLERAVSRLPLGLVFVSGSNGKSTTTNMLTGILREHGLQVFTNPSGGNLPQGIASAMLASVPLDGYVRADVGVIEVDEAYGVALADRLKPNAALLLNVQIDQLNRFFEPDRVVGMLRKIADTASKLLVVNANDDNLRRIATGSKAAGKTVAAFGVSDALIAASPHGLANVPEFSQLVTADSMPASRVLVQSLDGRRATLEIDGSPLEVALPARGLHNAVDAAGDVATAASAFSTLETVYGRGEMLEANGEPIEVIMMKNPPSLQLNLDALDRVPAQLLLAVDEGTPDPSWIYDTDFRMIDHVDVLTGTKAWQIATRLAYAGIPVGEVVPDLKPALEEFLKLPAPEGDTKVALVNYELMMELRKLLGYLDLEGAS
jgi:UDP-N-acetylmuramyl tripeptide synthase